MWTCPKCKIEIEPSFDVCWACGTSRDGESTSGFDPEAEGIMGKDTYTAESEAKKREDLVTLATFWNAPEAHVVRSRLEADGIAAVVTDELATTTTWGLLNDSGGVKVEVPAAQLGRARELMESCRHIVHPEERVVAQAVKEGIQTEPSPSAPPPNDTEAEKAEPLPDQLILTGYRSAIVGICLFPLLFFVPFHIFSLYQLLQATRLPTITDPASQRRFVTALTIDIAVILVWWVPVTAILFYLLVKWLM